MSVSTSSRACERCGRTITGRSARRFCSSGCRTAAHRARELELEELAGGRLDGERRGLTA